VLEAGGTILYPTDTVWGIGCDATNAEAIEKIYAIKKRPDHKACILLVANERWLLKYVANYDLTISDFLAQQSRPTTIIYPDVIGVANNVKATDGSAAIRVCENEFCQHLLKRFRKPIVSTSANISGQPTPQNFQDIDKDILSAVNYVVGYNQQNVKKGIASTVIRWLGEGKYETIRP